jgi:predicted transposase/invertase (TIGR01784 family)
VILLTKNIGSSIINLKLNKIYNLTNDYLFKKIFSNEKYLKYLLKEFFGMDVRKIKYLSPKLLKTNKIEKAGLVDLLIEADGEIIHLEMQNLDKLNLEDRIEFYSSKIISSYGIKKGEDFAKLKKIKSLAIINYKYKLNDLNNKVNLIIKDKNIIFNSKREYQILNLKEITKENINNYSDLYKLFKIHDLKILEKTIKNTICKEILKKIKYYNLDERTREKMKDIVELMKNEGSSNELYWEKGKNEGIIIGKKAGKIEGKNIEKNKIARNMLYENIDMSIISKVTGLDSEQILALK